MTIIPNPSDEVILSQPSTALHGADTEAERAALAALLARVEAAEGPDRELDRAIWWPVSCLPSGRYMEGDDGARYADVRFGYGEDRDWRHLGPYDDAPAYTASLDAALALCERALPGWLRMLDEHSPGVWTASLFTRPGTALHPTQVDANQGPATLALLSAMLKALIAAPASPGDAQSKAPDEPK